MRMLQGWLVSKDNFRKGVAAITCLQVDLWSMGVMLFEFVCGDLATIGIHEIEFLPWTWVGLFVA